MNENKYGKTKIERDVKDLIQLTSIQTKAISDQAEIILSLMDKIEDLDKKIHKLCLETDVSLN